MYRIYDKEIQNIFELIGTKEDDISKSISWVLYKSPHFLSIFLRNFGISNFDTNTIDIDLQHYEPNHGFSDIEISDYRNFHCIIEAKKGLNYPSASQLEMYATKTRHAKQEGLKKRIISLSEARSEYVESKLKRKEYNGYTYSHLSWSHVIRMCRDAIKESRSSSEKRVLEDLKNYLGGINNMQDVNSNEVYCVVINNKPHHNGITYMDVVEKYQRYFHPVGERYPYNPPNYLGIRYYGKLRNIYKIENYEVVDSLEGKIEGMEGHKFYRPHFLYELSKPMSPSQEVVNGDIYPSASMFVHLDLLLFSSSIKEAYDLTKERKAQLE